MINKITILIVLPLLLAGCSYNKGSSSTTNKHTLVLDYGFVFNHVQNQKGEQLAKLLLNDSYYSFPSEINIEEPIVAGDQLSKRQCSRAISTSQPPENHLSAA